MDPSGLQEMQVRRSSDGTFYANRARCKASTRFPPTSARSLKRSSTISETESFDSESNNPEKIEMHDAAKTISLTRNGDDWFSDGKKWIAASVDAFLEKIRSLAATKFVDSGFTKPNRGSHRDVR